ncbi:MAG: T9SS type A sorting domain-containing protein [Bacteroidetes bacterium]|nr:MAG: T9SS type A sorting domain-containing protein [Bacteroidota bacterium]
MKRKDFLRLSGLAGAGSLLPLSLLKADNTVGKNNFTGCALIPSETAGPYPLDLSQNVNMFRTDVRETQPGLEHKVRLRIIGINNCAPIQNARVDIWHCNVDGYYSGYNTNAHLGPQNHVGETFLRGIQLTDANGEVEFTTVFPGWYPGRISHIHFQVFLSSMLQVTSQFTYPVNEKQLIYTTIAPYTTWGADPQTVSTDNVFSDGSTLQVATLIFNSGTGGYDSFLEVGINGSGTTGLQNLEPETGGQFKLRQNFPNPYSTETTIPFELTNASDVKIELFDLSGRKVSSIEKNNLSAGEHTITLDMEKLGISAGNYVYQLEVVNRNGSYGQCKMMTAK